MHARDSYLLRVPYRTYPGEPAASHAMPPYLPPSDDDGMDLFRKLWRRKAMILVLALAGGVLATGVSLMLTPRYSAESRVLLGVDMPHVTDVPTLLQEVTANQEVVQSQGIVLTSRSIAAQVVRRLALDQDPEFNPALRPKPAWRAYLDGATSWLEGALLASGIVDPGPPRPQASEEQVRQRREQMVVSQLLSRLEAVPIERSHVLSITAQSENPETAARIADTVAKTYIEQQMIRRARVTENASEWLDQRIADLREKVESSERATEEYRRQHGLYETRNDEVTAQQLAELNTQMVMAETERAAAEARLAQVEQVERTRQGVESLPSVVNSPLIQALLQRQVEAERQAAELTATLGPQHPRMLDIRAQLADIKGRIGQEVGKVVQALRHEVAATQARATTLRGNLGRVQGKMGEDNEKGIELHQLERQAEANRRLLVTFLDRAKETEVQPNADEQSSILISEAAVPLSPGFPPSNMLRLLGLVGGALIGMVMALLRENLDRTFRTTRQIEEATNLPVLGLLPPQGRASFADGGPGLPGTPFGQAIGNLYERLLPAPDAQAGKIVMLTSATPQEGKSHIALALASLAASNGFRPIILDCDWRRPAINRFFSRASKPGLADLLAGTATPDEVVYRDPATGIHAVFAGDVSLLPKGTERFAALKSLLATVARHYDMVIVDTPPVLAGPDALALARMAGEVAFVVRWGKVAREVIVDAIRNLAFTGAKFGGVILSDVDPKRYRRYGMGDVVYSYPGERVSQAA